MDLSYDDIDYEHADNAGHTVVKNDMVPRLQHNIVGSRRSPEGVQVLVGVPC